MNARFSVYRVEPGRWRFTNFEGIAGDCDSWPEALTEALSLSAHLEATA